MPLDIDIARQIGAVTRSVDTRERDGRPARVIMASRHYATTIDDAWDALTSAERIPRWFLPVTGELRLGGQYQLKGNAGGTITTCEPPRHLAVTWEYGGDVSWVDVRLTAADNGGTLLELEHVMHVSPERWDEFGPGAVGVGWDQILLWLDRHLVSRATVDSGEAGAWIASNDGKEFVHRSSDHWRLASITAGTDPAAARAAAERTTAAYNGADAAEPPAPDGGA